jgi:hypothetical protein
MWRARVVCLLGGPDKSLTAVKARRGVSGVKNERQAVRGGRERPNGLQGIEPTRHSFYFSLFFFYLLFSIPRFNLNSNLNSTLVANFILRLKYKLDIFIM